MVNILINITEYFWLCIKPHHWNFLQFLKLAINHLPFKGWQLESSSKYTHRARTSWGLSVYKQQNTLKFKIMSYNQSNISSVIEQLL